MDEDRRQPGLAMLGDRDTSDIPPIADGEEREDTDRAVLDCVKGSRQLRFRDLGSPDRLVVHRDPESGGHEL